jgi:hypothetical protein
MPSPCPNNPYPFRRMRPAPHRFQSNFLTAARFSALHVPKLRVHRNVIVPLSSVPHSFPLCYNRPAVERTAKLELARGQAEPAQAVVAPLQYCQTPLASAEDPSRYCPVCSQRLESRRCKLICSVCGYYMSCADYY